MKRFLGMRIAHLLVRLAQVERKAKQSALGLVANLSGRLAWQFSILSTTNFVFKV